MGPSFVSLKGRIVRERLSPLLHYYCPRIDIKRFNYIVLIPEVPPDTPETNSLLRTQKLPSFSQLTVNKCFQGVGKLLIEFESGISKQDVSLKANQREKSFSDVFDPIEQLSIPLDYAIGTMNTLGKIKAEPNMINSLKKIYPRVQISKGSRFTSRPIYQAVKGLKTDKSKLTEDQLRVVDKYLLEARLRGIEITDDKRSHLNDVLYNLNIECNRFRLKLDASTARFTHTLRHPSLAQSFPDSLLKRMAVDKSKWKEGPWVVRLDKDIYEPFMAHCKDRTLRDNIWAGCNSRASVGITDLNNSITMEEIRFRRWDLAKLLGFETFADMSMETKMAGSVENVNAMITTLHLKSKQAIEKELLELQEYAMQNGFNGQLELWDIPYWRQQQHHSLFKLDEFQVSQYFPWVSVLKGTFQQCKRLFGVTFKDCTADTEVWDEHVKFYQVYDENSVLKGSFYLDPFQREDKRPGPGIDILKSRSEPADSIPLSTVMFNFPSPLPGRESLLTFKDLETVFKKFGHLLQHTLTTSTCSEVSGLNNLEWDVVSVVPHFMAHWLKDYATVASLSQHVNTGEKIPKELHKTLRKARNHLAAFDLTRELYFGALDMELHSKRDFWLDVTRSLWSEFMPFVLDKRDSHPCSFRKIFCGQYPASYFSEKWAEMMAADLFSTFYEVGLSNEEAIQGEGRRFRDTYLSLGGGCMPGEVFRRFRGRNPSLDALLVTSGLVSNRKEVD